MKHELEKGWLGTQRQGLEHLLGLHQHLFPLSANSICFVIVQDRECRRLDMLVPAYGHHPVVLIQQRTGQAADLGAKLLSCEAVKKGCERHWTGALNIIGELQGKGNGHLQRFDIANIEDPNFVCTSIVCLRQLLPYTALLRRQMISLEVCVAYARVAVNPLIRSWFANIF